MVAFSESNSVLSIPSRARPCVQGSTFAAKHRTVHQEPSLTRSVSHSQALQGKSTSLPKRLHRVDHSNQQYSILAISDSNGAVVERVAYQAYGQPTFTNAAGSTLSSSAKATRYSYTGREWDASLELHHFRARWMSGVCGRFVGRDPIGFLGSKWNLLASYLALKGVDSLGTHVALNPPTLPHGQPWKDGNLGDLVAATTPIVDIQCPCSDCKKCPNGMSQFVDFCTFNLSFSVTINVPLARLMPPPNPLPEDFSEPEYTYGHEQRHIQNAIAEASRLMRELDAYSRKSTCKHPLECENESLKLRLNYTEKFFAFWKREAKHLNAPFNVQDGEIKGFPPIGKMPEATR